MAVDRIKFKIQSWKDYLVLFSLFPLYFSTNGLYMGQRDSMGRESGGFIMPLAFYVGLPVFFFLLHRLIFVRKKFLTPKSVLVFFSAYMSVSLLESVAGTFLSANITPLIFFLQNLSGGIGIVLAIWIFRIRRIDFASACGFISILFLANIILQITYISYSTGSFSMANWGVEYGIGRFMAPRTFFWGIYQGLIYYPAIIVTVFLFAVPFWSRTRWFLPVYIIVGLYLWILQVRCPIVTYFASMMGYFLIFYHNKKKYYPFLLIVLVSIAVMITVKPELLKRFQYGSALFLRFELWFSPIAAIKEDFMYFFYGTLFGGTKLEPGFSIKLNHSLGGGLHNQYVEIIKNGGLILFLAYVSGFIYFVRSAWKNCIRFFNNDRDLTVFWGLFVIIVQSIVDMNFNTPLRVTNPAIFLWFFWTGWYLKLVNSVEEPAESKVVVDGFFQANPV